MEEEERPSPAEEVARETMKTLEAFVRLITEDTVTFMDVERAAAERALAAVADADPEDLDYTLRNIHNLTELKHQKLWLAWYLALKRELQARGLR